MYCNSIFKCESDDLFLNLEKLIFEVRKALYKGTLRTSSSRRTRPRPQRDNRDNTKSLIHTFVY